MNTDTGRIYRTAEEIEAAKKRGEPLVEIATTVADMMEAKRDQIARASRDGQLNRHERRKFAAMERKAEQSKP